LTELNVMLSIARNSGGYYNLSGQSTRVYGECHATIFKGNDLAIEV